MAKVYKYGRRPIDINEEKFWFLKAYAKEKGMKLYALVDDLLEAGMKRKRIMPDGVPEGTADGEGAGTSVPVMEV